MRSLIPFLMIILLLAGTAEARTRRLQISDLEKLVSVSDPQIFPDDRSIALVVSGVNMKEEGCERILCGTGDFRVPVVESCEMFHARMS